MSLSKLYRVYCDGRRTATGHDEHAEDCPVFSPNMFTAKEARAEATRRGWYRDASSPRPLDRVDLSPECAKREGKS